LLLGNEDDAHATFADLFQELVGADDGARAFGDRFIDGGGHDSGGRFQEAARLVVRAQEGLDALPQLRIGSTLLVQKRGSVGGREFNSGQKHGLHTFRLTGHGWPLYCGSPYNATFQERVVEKSREILIRDEYVRAALFLARCVPLAEQDARLPDGKRKKLAKTYADKAMKRLREAVDRGYKNVPQLQKDKTFDPLRDREDFQKLLRDLEGG
jgi:hypothetical protein